MYSRPIISLLLLLVISLVANAQEARPEPGRKTIEISATEKIRVPADVATIKIGFQSQAANKDAAYAENTRTANKILQALLDAGVPKESIETETLNLGQDQERFGAAPSSATKYSANQQWQIHAKASEAQKIVDIAVAAGANQIEEVNWSVLDEKQLEASAYAAALKRAKVLAEQTATQTGLKLGEILTVVNSYSPFARFGRNDAEGGELMYAMAVAAPKPAMLKLQPGFVERESTVRVIYSIAP